MSGRGGIIHIGVFEEVSIPPALDPFTNLFILYGSIVHSNIQICSPDVILQNVQYVWIY